ncbi:MAG: transglutaminase family protein, partial [Bacteroidaceae bacterium]
MKNFIQLTLLSALFVLGTSITANALHTTKPDNTIDKKETTELVDFLYKYMPLADKTDYPRSFFEENVNTSLMAKASMPWGKRVPELLFRHFVVPIRVNNENLDNSRMIFYKELKKRVEDLSMYDAILEVNHWCHERVTYQPSDGRTSAPLSTIRSAYGRCGEESTLTVAALRAIGIPARQVYTPRWAHTDDNHAWVEAWADGKWYFLGACEPEPVLNLAWFNAPVSRAMLTHTKAFGDYQGQEEVMLRTSNYTEINLIDNYGASARIDFKIVDTQNKPVSGARVDFKIYNYAEFCTVVTKYTNKQGETFLSAGKGDMIVWASHNGRYGFTPVSFGKDKSITITLNNNVGTSAGIFTHDSLNIIPPPENALTPHIDDAQRIVNNKRLAYEDSLRNAYVATFYNTKTASEALSKNNVADPDSSLSRLLAKSRGNHAVILDFIVKHKDNTARVKKLLSSLSDKDLRDMQTDILEDNFNAKSDQICPRVENEMIITPYKQFFETAFSKEEKQKFIDNPILLAEWINKNISLNPDKKALQIAQTPIGVWQSKTTDERSRKIFFVS